VSQHLINAYLSELSRLRQVSGANRESVVREAFKDLLKAWGRSRDLQFIAEHEYITPAKDRRYIDGALLYSLRVPFGYWEAKDEKDDLDAEIAYKFSRGYPQDNIIFEDSRQAVLIQDRREVIRAPVDDAEKLERLLTLFFSHQRPEIAEFRKAITQFKTDLPAVLAALRGQIDEAYSANAAFGGAAAVFLKQAKATINPAVCEADVREMLIQHILTEDIFARVFGKDDFHRENNIAKALYGLERLFFRGDAKQRTLHALEPYYAAIRSTAALIQSHSEKQGFLKAIYENLYKVYNTKAADRLGVAYTPNEIVRFMVESADWLCQKHFARSLIDRDVEILDPATGTGTFIVELLEHFRGQPEKLAHKYREELHANEVAILPYYVANLNIEATYAGIQDRYEEFPGLCFVDTLDNVAALGIFSGDQGEMFGALSDENSERVKRQNSRRISVIIGNPPYNAWQENYNQRNANRPYARVDQRIAATYIKEGTAQNKNSVYDMYTRFIRWASDRLRQEGIVAFIVGRKPFAKAAYDGFRKVVAREFAEIWVLDLGGDVRDNPKISGTKHNVFGIQTGVAIVFLVKKKGKGDAVIRYARRPEMETAEEKLAFLSMARGLSNLAMETIQPDHRGDWLGSSGTEWKSFIPLVETAAKASRQSAQDRAIFRVVSNGLKSQRDEWVYDISRENLATKAAFLVATYEAARKDQNNRQSEEIKWDAELERHRSNRIAKAFNAKQIVGAAYRPFTRRWFYFDRHFNGRTYQLPTMFPIGAENRAINFSGAGFRADFCVLSVDGPADLHFGASVDGYQLVSRYRYVGSDRLDNITDWALSQFSDHYGAKVGVTKDGVFAYVYAVLNDPIYRIDQAQNLKREFPRIPFMPNFRQWRDWGQALLDLHIGYENAAPFPLERIDTPDPKVRESGQSPRVILRSDHDNGVIVLDSETQLSGVPAAAWGYRLGNRCALDWVLDQHKEKTLKDPTVRERFNTYRFADHKEAVIDLLRRVTTVSVRTQEIVEAMRAAPR